MKDIAKWGTGDMDAEKMAYELVGEWLSDDVIVKTKEYAAGPMPIYSPQCQ